MHLLRGRSVRIKKDGRKEVSKYFRNHNALDIINVCKSDKKLATHLQLAVTIEVSLIFSPSIVASIINPSRSYH